MPATPGCSATAPLVSVSLIAACHSASSWTRSRVAADSRRTRVPLTMR